MDPNHWNYNQAYSRIASGSIPPGHGGINRLDFPLLDQATLSSGLSLPPSLPPHANLTSRSLGGIPGMNYPTHHLHSSMPQFLDPMSQLPPSFAGQPTYKPMPMAPNPFPFESPGRSVQDIPVTFSPSRYSTGAQSLSVHPKPPLFSPTELTSPKDLSSTFSTSVPPSSLTESSPKGWGLSNFLPSPTGFGNLTDPTPSDFGSPGLSQAQQTPPPAHSSGSRISTIQRNPYSADSLFAESSRPAKPSQPLHSPQEPSYTSSSSSFGRVSDSLQSPKSNLHAPHGYSESPSEIKDLSSSHHQGHQIYNSYISSTYNSIPSSNSIYSSSQLAGDMDYDPVSPATPLPEPQPSNDNNPFSTVSFQDLAALSTSPAVLQEKSRPRDVSRENILMQQESLMHSLEKSNRLSKESAHVQNLSSHMTMQHTPPGIHNGNNAQNAASPMQQSPISVGSPQVSMSVASPQISMPLGSPSSLLPSSTVVPAPPPVQAMADSTTKPKRGRGSRGGRGGGRGRRKKEEERNSYLGDIQQPPMFANEIAQQQQAQQPPQQFSEMIHTTQAYRPDNQNPGYMHENMSPLVEPSLTPSLQRQMSGQTPDTMQRSPLDDSLGMQMKDMGARRMQTLSEDLLSRHSSMSSLNSGHQQSPMQEAMSINPQAAYCDGMVAGQHPSPLANSSPQNQMPMEGSTMPRNTDSSSMTSHSALSDSSLDQRGSMLSAVRETEAIISGADQYNMNGFVDAPFMDQLTDTPPTGSQPMEYQQSVQMLQDKNGLVAEMGGHNSFQDAINNGMHMSQYGNSFQISQDQPQMTNLELDPGDQGGSTIDEATFSSLFGSPFPEKGRRRTKAEQKFMPVVTITPHVDEDEDLCHLAFPPPSICEPFYFTPEDDRGKKGFGCTFQDCFLNYLMGKKQETLESLSSATIHTKPQLPKYIPEPRRPRTSTPPQKDLKGASDGSDNECSSGVGFSDSDSDEDVTKTVQNVISQMSDEDAPEKPVKTKDLTIKISMSALRKASRGRARGTKSGRGKGSRGSRGKGKEEGDFPEGSVPNEDMLPLDEVPVVPPRERISRRAKDKAFEKKKKKSGSSASSSSDDENIKSITKEEDEKDYDSDKDPAWTPFEVDIKQSTYDETPGNKPKRLRRLSSKGKMSRSRMRMPQTESKSEAVPNSSLKVCKLSPQHTSNTTSSTAPFDPEQFGIGKFILEKKDMHNYESYPIWKIEQGKMIHKYEIFTEEGFIRHRAVSTYSSWMPTMRDQFLPVTVELVSNRDLVEIVEVTEECRPKPPSDGSLETKYEDDPLVDLFNVYLQIFLSQALETGFLSAITDAQDNFYLSALEKIDKMIYKKLEEIDKRIKWKPNFKESLKIKPQLREIDRPNLKQSCQACENSSPPTIKTVHFLGMPYDRFDLDELPDRGDICTEFMIGKTAAQHVGTYHSLHHFKYNLYKRCLAKVKLLKDTNKGISNEKLLDECLQNRAWVLKIFEDLKRMLEKG